MKKDEFIVKGMSCAACVSRIENSLKKLEGIKEVEINLLTKKMISSYDENIISQDKIINQVKNLGYEITIFSGKRENFLEIDEEYKKMKKKFIFSLAFTIPILIIVFFDMLGIIHNFPLLSILELIFTIPIIYLNRKIFNNGIKSFVKLSPNMDTLVAVGAGSAFLYSIFLILKYFLENTHNHIHLYFESSATILTFIALGKYLEAKSKAKTTFAIKKLISLIPKNVRKIDNGVEILVSVDDIKKDDEIIIKTGEYIPVDGTIIKGECVVDESNLTGEALPIYKKLKDKVKSGTFNQKGYIIIKVENTLENSTVNKIINLVEEAMVSKPKITKLADKIAGIFVPIVIFLASVSFVYWFYSLGDFDFAFSIFIGVLVISCPCALGLATPTAITVGSGVGAISGILFKSSEAMSNLAKVKNVILDKTGTITYGKPFITKMFLNKSTNATTIFENMVSLEALSEHPLAIPIIKFGEANHIELKNVTNFHQDLGKGIEGEIDNKKYFFGNELYLKKYNLKLTKNIEKNIKDELNLGSVVLYFGDEENILAIIFLKDKLKTSSKKAIELMQSMNLNVVMATGDNKNTAKFIANICKIKNVYSQMLPKDKQDLVKNTKKQGITAMIGDGVNDAPSLAIADVGIAISKGSDITSDTADVIFTKNSLMDFVNSYRLSKLVLKKIKENLFWAFIYNIIGIPVAMGFLYNSFNITLNPIFCALAMSLSSVFVVTNALTIKKFKALKVKDEMEIEENNNFELMEIELNENKNIKKEIDKMEKITFFVPDMSCNHCVQSITKKLKSYDEDFDINIDLNTKKVEIISKNLIDISKIEEIINELGFSFKI